MSGDASRSLCKSCWDPLLIGPIQIYNPKKIVLFSPIRRFYVFLNCSIIPGRRWVLLCGWLCFWGDVQERAVCERKGIKNILLLQTGKTQNIYLLMAMLVKSVNLSFWKQSTIIKKWQKWLIISQDIFV